jgi:hypothetical protein
MKSPRGTSLAVLRSVIPVFLSYVLSFVYRNIAGGHPGGGFGGAVDGAAAALGSATTIPVGPGMRQEPAYA